MARRALRDIKRVVPGSCPLKVLFYCTAAATARECGLGAAAVAAARRVCWLLIVLGIENEASENEAGISAALYIF